MHIQIQRSMVDISIIIPVFNIAEYISECIESLLRQTFENYEIIIIDDGSSDGSSNLCEKYRDRYHKIQYYRIENNGVSNARNVGMSLATGQYIVFVDGDDVVADTYLEDLISLVRNDRYDWGAIGYTNDKNALGRICSQDYHVIESGQIKYSILTDITFGGYLWNKIFSRNVIEKNHLTFKSGIFVWEDLMFVLAYANYVTRCAVYKKIGYFYRVRANSAVRSLDIKKIKSKIVAARIMCEELKDDSNEVQAIVRDMYLTSYFNYAFFVVKSTEIDRENKTKVVKELISTCGVQLLSWKRLLSFLKVIIYFYTIK